MTDAGVQVGRGETGSVSAGCGRISKTSSVSFDCAIKPSYPVYPTVRSPSALSSIGKGVFGDPVHGIKPSDLQVPKRFEYDVFFDHGHRGSFRRAHNPGDPDLYIRDRSGRIKADGASALTCLQVSPEWQGCLAHYSGDSQLMRVCLTSGQNGSNSFYFLRAPPWDLGGDNRIYPYNIYYYPDAARLTAAWIRSEIGIVISPNMASTALVAAAITTGAHVQFRTRYPMDY